ncbi:MAG: dephospho-CoA kinase [Planctomycetes bacterium]|nr:dephospho-CoA kinase [Planctomycetota bacterium]
MSIAPPIVVGLTGGIASGKSTCARALAGADGEVIDADAIVRELQGVPEVLAEMERVLETPVRRPDGTFDREAVGRVVFSDAQKLKALEGILHPRVQAEIERRLRSARERASGTGRPWLVVLDVPLLLESGLDRLCDRIGFVESEAVQRAERARSTRQWSAAEVDRREAQQCSLEEKRRRADFVIENRAQRGDLEGVISELRARLRELVPTGSSSDAGSPSPRATSPVRDAPSA